MLPPRELSWHEQQVQAKRIAEFNKFDALPQVVRNAFNSDRRSSKGGVGTARDDIIFRGMNPEAVARNIRGT
jgi:hypothetical protein